MAQARTTDEILDRILPVMPRKEWIDGLRAMAMLFVIFGHQISGFTPFYVFTGPIMIPLFFMITGYVFKDSNTSIPGFFRNLFFRLIIPWFFLTIPTAAQAALSRGISALPGIYLKLVTGVEKWYMPCLVVAEILWFFIRRYARREALTCACALAAFALGIATMGVRVFNIAMVNRALLMQLFMLMGFLFRTREERLVKIGGIWAAVLCAAYVAMVAVSLAIWPGRSLDVHLNRYYSLPYCFAMMILGCFTAFLCARKLARAPRVLRFIGQNTLVYYLLHAANIVALKAALAVAGIALRESLASAVIKTLFACVGCWLEAMILNRFFPEAVGRKRRRTARP